MGFTRQKHWSGLPCPPLGDLPNPGINTASCIAGRFFTTETPGKRSSLSLYIYTYIYIYMDMERYINRKKERKRNRGRRKKITRRKNIAQGTL